MIHTVATAYGAPAHAALRDAVADSKQGDPLAPVSVVVPSHYVGLAARRSLGRAGGVAAVTFLTPYRLAELLEGLPCMREPTVASTHSAADPTGTPTGYAVKVAVPRADLPTLIPQIKARGGTDIIVTNPEQIVP